MGMIILQEPPKGGQAGFGRAGRLGWAVAAMVFGMLLLNHGCSRYFGGGGHVFGAEVAQGEVVATKSRPSTSGRRRGMVIEATVEFATADGRRIRVEDKTGHTGSLHPKGERLPVYYDPANPEAALIGGTAPFTVTPYLFEGVAGLVLLVAGGVLLIILTGRIRRARQR